MSISGGDLRVRLNVLERLGALHRDVDVPLDSVVSAHLVADPFTQLRGVRAPGTGFPGLIALGVRRWKGVKDFVAVYARQEALLVELEGATFDRLLLGSYDHAHLVNLRESLSRHLEERRVR